MIATVSGLARLDPFLELRDSNSNLLASAAGQIDRTLTNAGDYFIVAYDAGNDETGPYRLWLQRVNNPCNATNVPCGSELTGAISEAAEIDTYSLQGAGPGDTVDLWMIPGSSVGRLELYDGRGVRIATSLRGRITHRLSTSGPYTVLAFLGDTRTSEYRLSYQKLNNACLAGILDCGQLLTRAISPRGDIDTYRLQGVNPGDSVILRMTELSEALTPEMELYNGSGTLIGNASFGEISAQLSGPGPYTLLAYSASHFGSGTYTLFLEQLYRSCGGLVCGTSITNSIDTAGEVDSYRLLDAEPGDQITVRMFDISLGVDPYLELYDSTGTVLTDDDSARGNFAAAITLTLSNSGPYVVRARDAFDTFTGDYRMFYERLNRPCTRTFLNLGQSVTNEITFTAEIDAYRLAGVAPGDTLYIEAIGMSGTVDPHVELFDGSGRDPARSRGSLLHRVTHTGPYVLLLRDHDNMETGEYRVSLSKFVGDTNSVPLTCGSVYPGWIEPSEGADLYHFEGVRGDRIALYLTSRSEPPVLGELFEPGGNRAGSLDESSHELAETGTYTIAVASPGESNFALDYYLVLQNRKAPCQAVAIPCGVAQAGSLPSVGAVNAYTFNVTAGETIVLQSGSTTPFFELVMELLDPQGEAIDYSFGSIISQIGSGGSHTVLIRANPNATDAPSGDYVLRWNSIKTPCASSPLTAEQVVSSSIDSPDEFHLYTFSAGPGDITICLATQPDEFIPAMELFDADGNSVVLGTDSIHETLQSSEAFRLLVNGSGGGGTGSYNLLLRNGNVACDSLDLDSPVVSVLQPSAGAFVVSGAAYQIAWQSNDNQELASHEIRASSDGGITFPTVVAANLSGATQNYTWLVPAGITTSQWRVRVIARDAAGNVGFDDSDSLLVITEPAALFGIVYAYDELSQLIRAEYTDGSVISYGYDAAGNRTNMTIFAGNNADNDGDGMLDSWETSNGLDAADPGDADQDADRDGLTNLQEFRAGTDPQRATSRLVFTEAAIIGNNVRIRFQSMAGRHYLVQWTDALQPENWNSSGAAIAGTGNTTQFTDIGGISQAMRFYRLLVLP